MTWTASAIGAALFVTALVFMRRHKAPRTQAWLMLFAGVCLSGLLGRLIGWLTSTLTSVGGTVTGVLFGVAVPALLAFTIGVFLILDMTPRRGSPKRWTPWAALVIVPLVAATFGGAAALLPERINQIVTQAAASIGQVLGDLLSQI